MWRAIEAGLLLIDVDFNSTRKPWLTSKSIRHFEMGLDRPGEPRQGSVYWPAVFDQGS